MNGRGFNYKPSENKQEVTNLLDKKNFLAEKEGKIIKRSEVIGITIKYLRNRKGITQKEVAQKIGIAQQTYAGYESGKHEPSIEIMIRLADFYEISMDYITCRFYQDIAERDIELEIETEEILENTIDHYLIERKSEIEYMKMVKKQIKTNKEKEFK